MYICSFYSINSKREDSIEQHIQKNNTYVYILIAVFFLQEHRLSPKRKQSDIITLNSQAETISVFYAPCDKSKLSNRKKLEKKPVKLGFDNAQELELVKLIRG